LGRHYPNPFCSSYCLVASRPTEELNFAHERADDHQVEISRAFIAHQDFDLDMERLEDLCSFGGLSFISWFLSQDVETVCHERLISLLYKCCHLGPWNEPHDWFGIVSRILKQGVDIHAKPARSSPWYNTPNAQHHIRSPLDLFLWFHQDVTPWLKVLLDSGVDLQQYARHEQELHNFNHHILFDGNHDSRKVGLYNVKYIYPRSSENTVQIRLGALVDWETAFAYNALFRPPHYHVHFGLKYLFEGFVDKYPWEPDDDEKWPEWGEWTPVRRKPGLEKAFDMLSDHRTWFYWIIISLVCHLYFHWWILPWVSRFFGY
jgi:hypothetical protein